MRWRALGALTAAGTLSVAGCSLLFEPAPAGGDDAATAGEDAGTAGDDAGTAEDLCALGWSSRIPLSIENAGPEDIEDVPVLAVLDRERAPGLDFDLRGADLRFVGADGAVLPHEVDTWSPDSGLVWFRIPTLPAMKSTTVSLHYGNPAASDAQSPGAVWASFAGVWHMKASFSTGFGDVFDSSPNAHHGRTTTITSEDERSSPLGEALLVEGGNPEVTVAGGGTFDATDAVTVEGWLRSAATEPPTIGELLLRKSDSYHLWVRKKDADYEPMAAVFIDSAHYLTGEQALMSDTWTYLALVFDGSGEGEMSFYQDGQRVGGPDPIKGSLDQSASDLEIGVRMMGLIDEVRVSTVPRSFRWIALQHASAADQLIEYGVAEPCP